MTSSAIDTHTYQLATNGVGENETEDGINRTTEQDPCPTFDGANDGMSMPGGKSDANQKSSHAVNGSSPFLQAAPAPPTELGVYRLLAPRAALLVSPLQLGGMSFGDAWAPIAGLTTKDDVFKLLDAFVSAGGNFLDTANVYQNEQSEIWIGEWMNARRNRDRMVVATKYSAPYTKYRDEPGARISYLGNGKRSLHLSVRDSLRKLQTDWIDILYLHWWDWTTSIKEVMDSLHILVQQGKVLYLGISNTPAWIVSAANTYALDHGKTPFSVYQGQWNIMARDIERDILPMCRHFGMGVTPYDAIGGGKLRSKKQLESGDGQATGKTMSPQEVKMSEALETVAREHGIESPTAVALAWLLQKQPYVFPIMGTRNIGHMQDNIQALKLRLTTEQMQYIESFSPFNPGYPEAVFGEDPSLNGKAAIMTTTAAATLWVQSPKAIGQI